MAVDRPIAVFAAGCGALAVVLGAFAAHGAGPQVKSLLTTGAHYQMVHALLALVCAAWPARPRLISVAGWMAASGGLIFMLSLTAVGLFGVSVMGAVAPVGGTLMVLAWLITGIAVFQSHFVNA